MRTIPYILKTLKSKNIRLAISDDGGLLVNADKGVMTADLLELIKANKEALIVFIQKHTGKHDEIPIAGSATNYPLSPGQEGIWLASILDEGTNAYVISRAIKITGKLEQLAMNRAIQEIIKRHEILRTSFKVDEQGQIRQHISAPSTGGFEMTFTSLEQEDNGEETLAVKILAELNEQFDFNEGRLLRATLFTVQENEYIFVLSIHHIISDGWSVEVFMNELIQYYNAFVRGGTTTVPTLRLQYKDYAVWQQSQPHAKALGTHKDFWLKQFEGDWSLLDLPTDYAKPKLKSFNGQQLQRVFDKEKTASFKQLCRAHEASLFMGLLATFNVLLYRYTKQTDSVVGSPVAGREHPDLEQQIGLYINTIALRNRFSNQDSFETLLAKVRENTINALEHQAFPLDKLVSVLKEEKGMKGSALYNVMLILQPKTALHDVRFSDTNIEAYPLPKTSAQFDLTFELREVENTLKLVIDYNTDIFKRDRIERMANHFDMILSAVVANPAMQINKLRVLTRSEEQELLVNFNKTEMIFPKDQSLIDLFEEQVAQTPDHTAVVFDNGAMSYRMLQESANQFANFLKQDFTVRPDDVVAIHVEKSEWTLIAILAILKCDASYVPIDINNPKERIAFIQEDSGSRLTVNTEIIERFKKQKADYNIQNPERGKKADWPLVTIYTSGSTDLPKGVVIRQQNLLNRLYWMWKKYPFGINEVGSVKTSIGFVDHLWEIFGPLLKGVKLVLFKKADLLDAKAFIKQLSAHKVSRIVLVPSLLKEILVHKEACAAYLQNLKYWTCSGELLPSKLVNEFYEVFKGKKLINIYGSTEVCADATFYDCAAFIQEKKTALTPTALFNTHGLVDPFADFLKANNPIIDKDKTSEKSFENVSFHRAKSFGQYKEYLLNDVVPGVVNVSSNRFIGHMTGQMPPVINYLNNCVNQLNQNLVKYETSGVATHIERQVLGCFHNLIYRQPESFYDEYVQNARYALGNITSGGTISNITAISYSLSKKLSGKDGVDTVNRIGLVNSLNAYGYSRCAIIGSSYCHYSISKALKLLGLGTDSFVPFNFNRDNLEESAITLGKKIEQLQQENCLIVAMIGVAGTTESGAIDPLDTMAEIAQKYNIHFHVDGAFGGAFLFSDQVSGKLKGIEKADSVTMCGHKQLYLPVGISLCVFKEPEFVKYSEVNTYYQARKESIDLGKFTIEGTRPFSALILHGALQVFGKEGYEQVLNSNYALAQLFSKMIIEKPEFDLFQIPDLNILLYRFVPENFREKVKNNSLSEKDLAELNKVNILLQQTQFERGVSFVSYTKLYNDKSNATGSVWLRVVMMNTETTADDLTRILDEQISIAGGHKKVLHPGEKGRGIPQSVPIGKPIANTLIYILDESLNLLPIGVPGEIHVSGNGVAGGYLNNRELSSEKFIENPYKKDTVLFKTGDIGRWLADGTVEYFGRKDSQIKIRGHRVDLNEIESAGLQNESISNIVVTAGKNEEGVTNLVAYIICDNPWNPEEIRNALLEKIPDYMVPTYFVRLEEIPLNINGKIDWKSLPRASEKDMVRRKYIGARNETELILVNIWKETLGLKMLGVDDNFFEVGGHSLMAAQLVNKINKELNWDIGIKDVFLYPTVREMNASSRLSDYIPILRVPDANCYPMTPTQKRFWVLSHFKGGNVAYNMPSLFYLEGDLNLPVLEESFNDLLEKHENLRTVFIEDESGDPVQQIRPLNEMGFKVHYETVEANKAVIQAVVSNELKEEFDLEEGPLIKVTLLKISPTRHLLVFVVHHIISDGLSLIILTRDVLNFYTARVKGKPATENHLPIQYRDYAVWLTEKLKAENMQLHKSYWLEKLKGEIPKLTLDNRTRPKIKTFNGAAYRKIIPADLAKGITALAMESGATLFMGLLAVVNTLLHRFSAEEDILVGSPIAGRSQIELENQIGLFVNNLVYRNRIRKEESFVDLLSKIQQTAIEAYEHQVYPFDELVDNLVITRDPGRNVLFDFVLVFQEKDYFDEEENRNIEGITIRPYEEEVPIYSKFDIAFYFISGKEGLNLSLVYNTDIYDKAFIENFYNILEKLLANIIADPEMKIGEEYYSSELLSEQYS